MFGYIRPLKGELKVREFDDFKAMYCGLCHALKKHCGFASRFIINYDFTFLALLLSNLSEKPQYCRKRCIASPIRKKCCAVQSAVLEKCADLSVVLTYWKLKDARDDGKYFKRLGAGAAMLMLRKAYRKAVGRCPDFARLVQDKLSELAALESEHSPSLDRTADCFAAILRGAVAESEGYSRILGQLLYHIGRWIYITDALDDFEDDAKNSSYNPLIYRFEIADGKLPSEKCEYVRTTLEHSAALAASALELLPEGHWSPILTNIIYLGLPWVAEQVLSGAWKHNGKITIDNEWRKK